MGLPRSTFYDVPAAPADEAEIIARMRAIRDEFEAYGYCCVGAALHDQVEGGLRPGRRRRVCPRRSRDGSGAAGRSAKGKGREPRLDRPPCLRQHMA
jgi:hypothetical protein